MAATLFLLLLLLSDTTFTIAAGAAPSDGVASNAPYVGVCISTALSNPVDPAAIVKFLISQKVSNVRLYDANPSLLSALAGTGIRVVVGIPNNELVALGSSFSTASTWVSTRILPFLPSTSIAYVAVGDEVATAIPSSLPLLLPALRYLSAALAADNASKEILVSTPLPFSTVLDPFPPSQAFFNQTLAAGLMVPLLTFLANTSAPLMVNLYPYYAFMRSNGIVPLDNALFKPLPAALEMVDPNTQFHYTNVYDAMVDALHFAMRNLNFTTVPVLVTETGWPSYGAPKDEPFATKENAETYNSNLIKHVFRKTGTPLLPETTSSTYIYELFNEDQRPGPVSEANWGLFYGNGTPVYMLHVEGEGAFLANDTTNPTFCVVSDGADMKMLQTALDWACGSERADCKAIQSGESCYLPNSVRNHASYAFDSYYQSQGRSSGSCYFQGTAMVTTIDPSYGSCIFPGRKSENNLTMPSSTNTTTQSSYAGELMTWRLGNGRGLPLLVSAILIRTIGCFL